MLLGLLIERATGATSDEGAIASILGEDLARWRLSRAELRTAVNGLISYLEESADPHPTAVWALGKSYQARIVPALIGLLDRVMDDPAAEAVSCQAIIGIINAGMGTRFHKRALAALRRAEQRGHGEVAEAAADYLHRVERGKHEAE
jgi:hypothetical protein